MVLIDGWMSRQQKKLAETGEATCIYSSGPNQHWLGWPQVCVWPYHPTTFHFLLDLVPHNLDVEGACRVHFQDFDRLWIGFIAFEHREAPFQVVQGRLDVLRSIVWRISGFEGILPGRDFLSEDIHLGK